MDDEGPMTPGEAERAHLRGPEGAPDAGHRRMQELRKIGRDYPFICPVDFKPHKGSPPGEDPNLDPDFIPNHREDDGADYLYTWAREQRMTICNRMPTPFEAGMQPYLPSRHSGGRLGLCDGHHQGV